MSRRRPTSPLVFRLLRAHVRLVAAAFPAEPEDLLELVDQDQKIGIRRQGRDLERLDQTERPAPERRGEEPERIARGRRVLRRQAGFLDQGRGQAADGLPARTHDREVPARHEAAPVVGQEVPRANRPRSDLEHERRGAAAARGVGGRRDEKAGAHPAGEDPRAPLLGIERNLLGRPGPSVESAVAHRPRPFEARGQVGREPLPRRLGALVASAEGSRKSYQRLAPQTFQWPP